MAQSGKEARFRKTLKLSALEALDASIAAKALQQIARRQIVSTRRHGRNEIFSRAFALTCTRFRRSTRPNSVGSGNDGGNTGTGEELELA
jgi:hypothetical protein